MAASGQPCHLIEFEMSVRGWRQFWKSPNQDPFCFLYIPILKMTSEMISFPLYLQGGAECVGSHTG